MKRYFKYGNAGGINKVIKREINSNSGYYKTLKELLDSCKRDWNSNLKISWYCYDDRLGKDVYMVLADHDGYEQTFTSYFIEEEKK